MMKKLVPPIQVIAMYYRDRIIVDKPYAFNVTAYWLDRLMDVLLGL